MADKTLASSKFFRERMKWGLWKGRHVPGAQLASDLLTKAVTSMPSWTKFYNFMGMYRLDELGAAEPSSCTEGRVTAKVAGAVLAAIIGLTVVTTLPKEAESTKVACAVGVAALTAWLVKKLGPGGIKNVVKEDPTRARQKAIGSTTVNLREGAPEKQDIETRCQRENEPWPNHHGTRGHEPVSDPGVRVHEPLQSTVAQRAPVHVCAARVDPPAPMPWDAVEFDQPPRAANEDRWAQMSGGWIVMVHRSWRSQKFHPVHRSCPVRTCDLEPGIRWSGAHGWTKNIQHDEWTKNPPTPLWR